LSVRALAAIVVIAVVAVMFSACSHTRGYTTAPIVTHDDDRHLIAKPKDYWSSFYWDAADQMVFLPMVRASAVDVGGPAVNVNAHGEVPNSSWFTNRIGHTAISPERLARGPCREDDYLTPEGPWIATSGKVDGANPGIVIEDAKTHKHYVLKFDPSQESIRATAADVIGSKLYWAFGMNVPCNFIVSLDADMIQLGENATKTDKLDHEVPLTRDDVDKVLARAAHGADGRLRASASLYVEGTPIGPWTYEGRRRDDPNDVIDHQDRRELRGSKLMAAWLQHFDTREQNTLATFFAQGDRGWVEHWLIDFGDCLGATWASDDMSRRFGYSYYFDVADIVADLFTFGLRQRTWERVQKDPTAPLFGYYEYEHFAPDAWKGGYQNVAFMRMDDADAYWAAQIMVRFTERQIDAVIAAGKLENDAYVARLRTVMLERRKRIVQRYMYAMSAFERPQFTSSGLCFEDALVATGFESAAFQHYEARRDSGQWRSLATNAEGRLCVPIEGTSPAMIEAQVTRPGADKPARPVRFHILPGTDGVPYLSGVERVTP
jgi:hypothetical protein